jgi:hypothetical protein
MTADRVVGAGRSPQEIEEMVRRQGPPIGDAATPDQDSKPPVGVLTGQNITQDVITGRDTRDTMGADATAVEVQRKRKKIWETKMGRAVLTVGVTVGSIFGLAKLGQELRSSSKEPPKPEGGSGERVEPDEPISAIGVAPTKTPLPTAETPQNIHPPVTDAATTEPTTAPTEASSPTAEPTATSTSEIPEGITLPQPEDLIEPFFDTSREALFQEGAASAEYDRMAPIFIGVTTERDLQLFPDEPGLNPKEAVFLLGAVRIGDKELGVKILVGADLENGGVIRPLIADGSVLSGPLGEVEKELNKLPVGKQVGLWYLAEVSETPLGYCIHYPDDCDFRKAWSDTFGDPAEESGEKHYLALNVASLLTSDS